MKYITLIFAINSYKSQAPNKQGRLIVHQSPVFASGRVEGLPTGKQYWIQAFIITDKEWPQGSGEIQEDGSWKIDALYLGAVDHRLFFRIFDEDDTMIVESYETLLVKR